MQPTNSEKKTPLKLINPNEPKSLDECADQSSQKILPLEGETLIDQKLDPPRELSEIEQKILAKKIKELERSGMKPMPGFAWNPLKTLNPNRPCPCLSEKKFKACCLDKLAPVVSQALADDFKIQMEKPDLVFMTPDNEAKIKDRIAPHVQAQMKKQMAEMNERAEQEKRRIDDALSKSNRPTP
jgi:hypothetical protein